MLDRLRNLWNWIDQISSNTKTLIIIALIALVAPNYVDERIEGFRNSKMNCEEYFREKAERYAMENAPKIYNEVHTILSSDPDVSNVLLLQYHDTKQGIGGFHYMYISVLTEAPRDIEWKSEWKDLDFVDYSVEIAKIRDRGFLRVDSLSQMKEDFPRLKRRLEVCGIQSAGFYPIGGYSKPLGLLVILYEGTKIYGRDYASRYLNKPLQNLAILLNYKETLLDGSK